MAEIDSPDYPGERLVVCKNPLLGQERARKRSELLAATEKELIRIQARVQRASKPLHGAAVIGQAVGAVLGRRKMAKHFQISISDDAFGFTRDNVAIAAEAALDGIYVVRTNLPAAQSDAVATVRAYKNLSSVERAFRSMKTVDLQLRPVFHWTAPRVRATYCYACWPTIWNGTCAEAWPRCSSTSTIRLGVTRKGRHPWRRRSPRRRRSARRARQRTDPANGEPLPVHSFHTLLADLATLTRNVVRLGNNRLTNVLATPTRIQRRSFDLLGVALAA
jgi:hypothetical protein